MARTRRSLFLVIGLLALLGGAGALYRAKKNKAGGGDAARGGASGSSGARGKGGAGGGVRPELPPDPRTLARGVIAGHVRDDKGTAIAGADVCVRGGSSELTTAETRDPRCAKTGADGGYRITDLYKATYRV